MNQLEAMKILRYAVPVFLPTVFSKGFTLMADNGSQVGELRFDSEVTFTAGKFKNITGALNTRISSWKTPLHDLYYQLATHTTASHAGLYNDTFYGNVYRNTLQEFLKPE